MEILLWLAALATMLAFLYGLILLIFKKGRRKYGAKIMGGSFFANIVVMAMLGGQIEKDGYPSIKEKEIAAEHGITTPEEWDAQREGILAEIERKAAEAKAAEKAERERLEAEAKAAEEARIAAEKAAEEQRIAAAKAAEEAAEAEERRKGFHCLSAWDGSHRAFKGMVEDRMRDPDSFEHIETRVTPVDADGMHTVLMTYRARNGFGGMNVGEALGRYRNDDCSASILSLE